MDLLNRLKPQSLKSKIVVPMVALAVLPATGIGIFAITRMQEAMRTNAIERDVFDTSTRAQSLEGFLRGVETDLLFLARTQFLNDLARARTSGDPERVDVLRKQAERELQLFSQGKRSFYQVRYIDTDGREVVRLNVEEGISKAVPVAQLQDKRGRPYVAESLKLDKGEIYTSPMDLNAEHGRIEVPHRPVLRYGTALFDNSGKRTGVLILNLNANHLFRLVGPLAKGSEAFLVDQDGVYLSYIGPSDERRSEYSLLEKRQLKEDYSPAETDAILRKSEAGDHFETPDKLVSIGSIVATPGDPPHEWRLIVTQSSSEFGAPIRALTWSLSLIIAAVLAIVAMVGIFVTNGLAKPVTELRKAMRLIATDRGAGMRLDAPESTNEIESLSQEFQMMAQRLEQATSRLHGLQGGLAEADKLSSIGQLTSGLAHEFDRPLGALKNKVGALGEDSASFKNAMLEDIAELEKILESFAHLVKTSQPKLEVTSLAAVVQSVVTLVGSELAQRGLEIEVDAEPGVPAIKGDLNQLRQLFINLILNAADSGPKSKRIAMKISSVMSDDAEDPVPIGAEMRVIDDGRGIPTGDMVKIWDPFFTTKKDGVGLGLPICRQLVEEMNGRIEVSSQANHGTTVTVSLPMETPEKG
jgi:signal transduction histidine kinase